MTWQWVAIILGIVGIVALHSCIGNFFDMKVQIARVKRTDLSQKSSLEDDTIVQPRWPTGGE